MPLIVGTGIVRTRIFHEFPLLNDKLYIVWDDRSEPVVNAVLQRLSRQQNPFALHDKIIPGNEIDKIPLPQIKKRFSQRDKDIFIMNALYEIRDYFRRALSLLEKQYAEVETNLSEITPQKFTAKIYLRGETKCLCKVWIGGLSGTEEIGYSEGHLDINSDNSFNEILSIEESGIELKLKFVIGIFYHGQEKGLKNPKEAAEILWKRFTTPLEHS